MKLLFDTRALLWSIIPPEQLSPVAPSAITDPAAQVAASAVSFWEVAIKTSLGKPGPNRNRAGSVGGYRPTARL